MKNGPYRMELPIHLEISDLPPPDTVEGLWQKVPSATVPTSLQLGI
ncbi:MAG TPA: hypothetical protein PLP99_02405 [Ignavibacteriales bacterium]|nr:hypothetical protein [Ignavibacteriales bacterium]